MVFKNILILLLVSSTFQEAYSAARRRRAGSPGPATTRGYTLPSAAEALPTVEVPAGAASTGEGLSAPSAAEGYTPPARARAASIPTVVVPAEEAQRLIAARTEEARRVEAELREQRVRAGLSIESPEDAALLVRNPLPEFYTNASDFFFILGNKFLRDYCEATCAEFYSPIKYEGPDILRFLDVFFHTRPEEYVRRCYYFCLFNKLPALAFYTYMRLKKFIRPDGFLEDQYRIALNLLQSPTPDVLVVPAATRVPGMPVRLVPVAGATAPDLSTRSILQLALDQDKGFLVQEILHESFMFYCSIKAASPVYRNKFLLCLNEIGGYLSPLHYASLFASSDTTLKILEFYKAHKGNDEFIAALLNKIGGDPYNPVSTPAASSRGLYAPSLPVAHPEGSIFACGNLRKYISYHHELFVCAAIILCCRGGAAGVVNRSCLDLASERATESLFVTLYKQVIEFVHNYYLAVHQPNPAGVLFARYQKSMRDFDARMFEILCSRLGVYPYVNRMGMPPFVRTSIAQGNIYFAKAIAQLTSDEIKTCLFRDMRGAYSSYPSHIMVPGLAEFFETMNSRPRPVPVDPGVCARITGWLASFLPGAAR